MSNVKNVSLATGESIIADCSGLGEDKKYFEIKNAAIVLRKDITSPMMLLPWIDHAEKDQTISISADKVIWYCDVSDELEDQYDKAVTKWYSNLVVPDAATTQRLKITED
jgi:hypothetical protein